MPEHETITAWTTSRRKPSPRLPRASLREWRLTSMLWTARGGAAASWDGTTGDGIAERAADRRGMVVWRRTIRRWHWHGPWRRERIV